MKFMKSLEPLGLLALRVALALIFVYHGYPKLVHPSAGMHEFFMSHGLPTYLVSVAGILETFGSALLFVGLFTRPVALVLTIEMGVAIGKVHALHGIMKVSDYEFPLAVAAGCFVLATIGAGALSADHVVLGEGGKARRTSKPSKN